MSEFVELWVCLSATSLFGRTATLVVYTPGAKAAYTLLGQAQWTNPALDSDGSGQRLARHLRAQPSHFAGSQFIHFLLGPAVVALAWPLWLRREELRQRWVWAARGFALGIQHMALALHAPCMSCLCLGRAGAGAGLADGAGLAADTAGLSAVSSLAPCRAAAKPLAFTPPAGSACSRLLVWRCHGRRT